MKLLQLLALGVLGLVASGANAEDTTVVLKGTHLCCGQCVKAVGDIVKKIDGCTAKCDQKGHSVTLTAKDDATAQKALDALASGGFHGTTDSKTLTIKDDSGATEGKVKTLALEGVHNCCGSCNKAIVGALSKVEGVTGNTAKVRSSTFEVTGNFDAEAVVKALNAAGYHVKVKK
ncbi:MAG TPA: cation transporter [Fimbriiglobus sp.]|jgi:copper chaperone CopZ